jgi:PAS domain S-box-containing protein
MLRAALQGSDERFIEHAILTNKEYLEFMADNRFYQHLTKANAVWLEDRLGFAGKYDVVTEDITKGVFLRNKALKKFLPAYTKHMEEAMALSEEIDDMTLASLTLATKTLVNLLHDKINKETHFSNRLISASPGIIFIYSLVQKEVIYMNQHVEDVLGYPAGEIEKLGREDILQYIHPEDIAHILELVQEFYVPEENKTFQFEYRFRHADGSYRWIRTYAIVFNRDEQGYPKEILGESYEVTKEKEITLALARRDEQLTEAQNIAGMGSFEWNFRDKTSNHSEQVYKIFEYSGERQFDEFIQFVHPEDREKVRSAFETSLVTGQYECEYRYIVNGREKYLWTKGVVSFENGAPYKLIGSVQDITERRKMEENLLQKTIELQKINADLSEFTYVASHDLKEPLRKISVFADMIYSTELEKLSSEGQSQLKKIVDSSLRMRNLIDDILTLSSVSAHREKEWVSLETLLQEVCGILDYTIKQQEAVVQSDGLPEALVVPVLIRQLFQNLIGNALKFAKPDERPALEISHAFLTRNKILTSNIDNAGYLQLKFKDNGIGFSNEFSEKIFQLFGRLHTQKQYEGTGLGLSICKKIVEEHGGTITAQGVPDQGATFTVTIPYEKKMTVDRKVGS